MAITEWRERGVTRRQLEKAARFVDWLVLYAGADRRKAAEGVQLFCEDLSPKRLTKNAPADPTIGLGISLYATLLQAKMNGETPEFNRDEAAGILARLIKRHGFATVEQRLRAYMASDDAFVRSTGYGLTLFVRQWNALAVASVKPRSGAMSAEETSEYLLRLRGRASC